jgi:hypothetical protein
MTADFDYGPACESADYGPACESAVRTEVAASRTKVMLTLIMDQHENLLSEQK